MRAASPHPASGSAMRTEHPEATQPVHASSVLEVSGHRQKELAHEEGGDNRRRPEDGLDDERDGHTQPAQTWLSEYWGTMSTSLGSSSEESRNGRTRRGRGIGVAPAHSRRVRRRRVPATVRAPMYRLLKYWRANGASWKMAS